MKLRLAICLAALLSGCSPWPEGASEGASAGSAVVETHLLPDCRMVGTQDQGADGWKHPDCALRLADASGLTIEARYSPAEDDSTKIKIDVVARGDARLQSFEKTMGNTFSGVTLQDIDGDGREDLLIPLETDAVNTSWSVWRQNEDGKSFSEAGEPSGVKIAKTQSGYVAVPARSSANQWDVAFYRIETGILKPILTANLVARGEPDRISGVDCTIIDDGGLASIGLTSEAVKKQFCADPAVAEIFTH